MLAEKNLRQGALGRKISRLPLADRVGREPYSIKELSEAIGYSPQYLRQVFRYEIKLSAMCALVLHFFTKGFLDPYHLLAEYGDVGKDSDKLKGLMVRYKDMKPTRNPVKP